MNNFVLIVEDDHDLADLLHFNLSHAGFTVKVLHSGMSAYAWLKNETPDLILLDLMLPGMDGLDICRQIKRDKKDIPIIMLTAKASEMDKVVGLELGVDDYVTKPFSMRELILRIKAVLRRKDAANEKSNTAYHFDGLIIDQGGHQVKVDGQILELTNTEFKLLAFLASRQGRVQNRDVLLEQVWGYDSNSSGRTVDTHMRRLRQKLGRAGVHLETIRGAGYRFNSSPKKS